MYKLTVFIPDGQLESVKSALFAAGAGQIGNYGDCCWQVKGVGQFMPLAGSQPHTGQQGHLYQDEEWRVEMVVADACLSAVIQALKSSHPYETPAYDVIAMIDV